jgi:hypothetical protein
MRSSADTTPRCSHSSAQVDHVLQYVDVLRYVDDRGWIRDDMPFDDLVEAFRAITCLETYVRFVQHDGKTPDQYKAFVTRTVRETIRVP